MDACSRLCACSSTMLVLFLSLLLLFLSPITCRLPEDMKLNHSLVLTDSSFGSFVKSPVPTAVWFHTEKDGLDVDPKDFEQDTGSYSTTLDESAGFLEKYGVKIGIVNCDQNTSIAYCDDNEATSSYLYVFRDGKNIVKLEVDRDETVDRVVANLIQVRILKKVPVINNEADIERKLIGPNRGKRHAVIAFVPYLGMEEHRHFMEAMYPYQDDFGFGVVTLPEVIRKYLPRYDESTMVLVLMQCKDAKEGDSCHVNIYSGAMDGPNFSRFFQHLKNSDDVVHILNDGDVPLMEDIRVHVAHLFYDKSSKDVVTEVARELRKAYLGEVGVVVVDSDQVDTKQRFQYDSNHRRPPVYSLRIFGQTEFHNLINPFNAENVIGFTKAYLEIKQRKKEEDPVQAEDSEVARSVYQLTTEPNYEITNEPILALTNKTFPEFTRRELATMVLFYVNYDAPSLAFLQSYIAEAKSLSLQHNPFTRVNCFDWTDVCQREKVFKFPTIKFYTKDKEPVEYKGMLDGKDAVKHLRVHQLESPLQLTNTEQANAYMSSQSHPAGLHELEVEAFVAAGLSSEKDVTTFTEAAAGFLGDVFFAYGTGEVANEICSRSKGSAPCVSILRQGEWALLSSNDIEADNLRQLMKKYIQPTLPELTVKNFPHFYNQRSPLTLFFGSEVLHPEQFKTMTELASSGGKDDRKYAWMDISKVNNLGTSILQKYSPNARIPAIALIDFSKGHVHVFDQTPFTTPAVEAWMKQLEESGKEPTYKMPDTRWAPQHPGYDFQRLKDDYDVEKARKNGILDDSDADAESGVSSRVFRGHDSAKQTTGKMKQKDDRLNDMEAMKESTGNVDTIEGRGNGRETRHGHEEL